MGRHSSQVVHGARTNITVNALDRHANRENANNAAFIWLAEDGTERIVTYGQLYRDVCRFANGLKSLGVKKGDRVVIYMPLTLEGVISMLACARIGAIHSVVYAGLGHTSSLRDRIEDAQAKSRHRRRRRIPPRQARSAEGHRRRGAGRTGDRREGRGIHARSRLPSSRPARAKSISAN